MNGIKPEPITRGEIWFACLDGLGSEQRNYRPVLIVQADGLNAASPTTIVVPITHQLKLPGMKPHCSPCINHLCISVSKIIIH